MVTKVVTEHDVDNVTIIINPQNKLEAKIPTSTPSEVVIEEVPNVTPANAVVTLNGTERKITKLGKVNGTEWLVFQLDNPPPPKPPKPNIQKNMSIEFYDDVGVDDELGGAGAGYNFTHTGKVRVIMEDRSSFSPDGNLSYGSFYDYGLLAVTSGNTGDRSEPNPLINFNTLTYEIKTNYSSQQTSSTLTSVNLLGTLTFSVEHEDAIYDYYITSVSVVQNTPTLPTFTVYSRGNNNVVYIDGRKTVTNSDGVVRFEFRADMSAYAKAGYKVYGVIKDNGATIYEAPLNDINQRTALGSGDIQYSEIDSGVMGGIVGKTLNQPHNLTAHVYLMNDAGDKVYPANKSDGFVDTLVVSVGLAND